MAYAGRRGDIQHSDWLSALGRAHESAATFATSCADLSLVFGPARTREDQSQQRHRTCTDHRADRDAPAELAHRLGRTVAESAPLAMGLFLAAFPAARLTRTELVQALRVSEGLAFSGQDQGCRREFFSVASLTEVEVELQAAAALADGVIRRDDLDALRLWFSPTS